MKKLITIFAILTLPIFPAMAETITVTGTVLDDTNQPALGAVVCPAGQQVQGKCQEVDQNDGSFSLSNISKNSNITIQLLGYTTKNLPANENMGTIVLQSNETILDAVTVTANPCDNKNPSEQNATALQWNKDLNKCVPTKCIEPRYKLENNICVDQVGKQCSDDIIISGSYKMSGNDLICAAKTCKCGYVKQGDECKPWDSNECTNKPKHATQVYRTCDWDDTEICEVMACSNGYEPNADGDACEKIPTKCTPEDEELHKKEGATKTSFDTKARKCIALSCKCGYDLENGACTPWPTKTGTNESAKDCTRTTKPSLPENAKSGTMQCKNDRAYCKISECISADYKLDENKNKCDSLNRESCTPTVENATGGKYKNVNGKLTCVITDCSDGFNPNKDGTKCVPECECGTEYDEKTNKCVKWKDTTCNDTQKPKLPSNATTGTKKCDNKNKAYCEVATCNDGYRVSDDKKSCTSTRGDACDADAKKIDNNATAGKIKKVSGKSTCVITACATGYDVNKDGTKCVPECECGTEYDEKTNKCVKWKDTTCNDTQKPKLPSNAATGTKKCDSKNKAYCEVATCNDGYRVSDDKKSCTSTRGDECNADAKKIDNNATAGKIKKVGDKMTCIITACANGYDVNKDGTKCVAKNVLSKEDSQKRIDELSENAEKMRQKEQSTENKLLGAAGMASVGIGGMQLASAASEQAADADAEAAMRAYLATFHCNYGGGKNIAGGERDVELPGGNELIGLYGEYVNLANDLKTRKAALGMRPGIESESILDSATSGLYDDIAIGKTSGAYTSLARALMDPNGADAAAWAAQKADTAQKLKTGAITAGIGAVATLAGNLALNSGDNKREKSAEINAKFDALRKPFEDAQRNFDTLPADKCSDYNGTTGVGNVPNCECKQNTHYFSRDGGGCIQCDHNKIYDKSAGNCACPSDLPVIDDTGNCINQTASCKLTGVVDTNACKCKANATQTNGNCTCDTTKHYIEKDGKCVCQDGYEQKSGVCTVKINNKDTLNIEIPDIVNKDILDELSNIVLPDPDIEIPIAELNIKADKAFEPGKYNLTPHALSELAKLKQSFEAQKELLSNNEYCVYIIGHTDRTQFKTGSKMNNQILSERRANSVRDELLKSTTVLKAENIVSKGMAESECTVQNFPQANDSRCRHVYVSIVSGKCKKE